MGGDDFFRSIAETDETANEPPSDRPLGTAARRAAATRSATPPESERPEVASSAGSTEEVVAARPPDARPARRLPRRRGNERGSSPPRPSGDAELEKPSDPQPAPPLGPGCGCGGRADAGRGRALRILRRGQRSRSGVSPAPPHSPRAFGRCQGRPAGGPPREAERRAWRCEPGATCGAPSHARQQRKPDRQVKQASSATVAATGPLPRSRGAVAKPRRLLDRAVAGNPGRHQHATGAVFAGQPREVSYPSPVAPPPSGSDSSVAFFNSWRGSSASTTSLIKSLNL